MLMTNSTVISCEEHNGNTQRESFPKARSLFGSISEKSQGGNNQEGQKHLKKTKQKPNNQNSDTVM